MFCTLSTNGTNFQLLVSYVVCNIGQAVIPLLFGVAIVMFVWGIVNFFIIGAGEEAKREQGRQFMIWGIIALSVMIGVWGLVRIVGHTFNIDYAIPQVRP